LKLRDFNREDLILDRTSSASESAKKLFDDLMRNYDKRVSEREHFDGEYELCLI